nr:YPO3983 family protein [Erwinia psidii]
MTPFTQPHSRFYGSRGEGTKITRRECARMLFDEFRHLSQAFSVYGPYRHLIKQMITHMQNNKGTPFTSMSLDAALKEHILNDMRDSSFLLRLKKAIKTNIDWDNKLFLVKNKQKLIDAILYSKLPKFNRFQDNFNGMGITVHDTWATQVTIKKIQINNDRYHALIHYKVQDHFGLDSDNILNLKFNQFRFFRIWFVLQRYNQLAFRPFMTNMQATVEITGERNEK